MSILSSFPTGGGSSSGGLKLAACTNISVLAASGKVYVKWDDPDDLVVSDSTLAAWSGTLLVRKAGSTPASRRDGTVILDSKTRDAYAASYFCDSGLTDGTTYYYKLFPYTTDGAYTDSDEDAFEATPTAQVAGIDSWNVTNMSAAAAGNGKLTVTWTDPAASITSDGVTLATWAATTIVVKAGSYATDKDDADAVYTLKETTRNQYSSTGLTISGLTNGTTYYISFFPETTDGGVNTSTSNRTTGTANRMTISTVPSQSGTLTYSGNAQSPTLSGYDSSKMTLGGTTSATNAGTYTETVTPLDDYMWSDGTTTAKSVSWTIGKAAGSLSLSKTSVSLDTDTTSTTVTATRSGNGEVKASSDNTSIATVSVSGTTITITGVATGSATITVTVEAGDNYAAVTSGKTISVTVTFIPALADATWAQIKEVSDAGTGANYWAVGDSKAITINGTVGNFTFSSLSVKAFILGFNHNSSKEGTNRIHFQIGKIGTTDIALCDSNYNSSSTSSGYFQMNTSKSNSGGWSSSYMRGTLLGSTGSPTSPTSKTLLAALPSDLRAVMKSVTKYTDNTGGGGGSVSSYVTATTDYLFLLSNYEVFGSSGYANTYEASYQAQYAYYSAGNSKIAYKHSSTSTAVWWWLRSPSYDNSDSFCEVYTSGGYGNGNASYSGGVRPGFCV